MFFKCIFTRNPFLNQINTLKYIASPRCIQISKYLTRFLIVTHSISIAYLIATKSTIQYDNSSMAKVFNAPLVVADDPQLSAQQIFTGTKQAEVHEEVIFSCDKCEKEFPKEKPGDLHLTKYHNTKSINYTI